MDTENNILDDDLEPEDFVDPCQTSWTGELPEAEDDWAVRNGIERRSPLDRRLGDDQIGRASCRERV